MSSLPEECEGTKSQPNDDDMGDRKEQVDTEGKEAAPKKEQNETEGKESDIDLESLINDIDKQREIIDKEVPTTPLEIALSDDLERKTAQADRLSQEVQKLKAFLSKRKQSYKRKMKDGDAPTRPLSAYNLFVQDQFSKLKKENEEILNSDEKEAQLKRIPPSSLVAVTGNLWKELSSEEKARYEEKARADARRYEEQMSTYKTTSDKKESPTRRKKSGYNLFFTTYVRWQRQHNYPLPSDRGAVARMVGHAWKRMTPYEKQRYEDEAGRQNSMFPI